MFRPQIILHPTDYSECANQAFDVAVDMARHYGAMLLVLHVADTLGPEHVGYTEAVSQRQPAGERNHLLEQLHRIQAPAGSGVHLKHLLEEGSPAKVIAAVAAREHCDLIVMGTYGRNALMRLVTGSVTERVSQLATCPVMTVRLHPGSPGSAKH